MVPPRILETDPVFASDEVLVTESTFSNKEDVVALFEYLKRSKASGTLTFHLVNGGKNRICFTQKQHVEVDGSG